MYLIPPQKRKRTVFNEIQIQLLTEFNDIQLEIYKNKRMKVNEESSKILKSRKQELLEEFKHNHLTKVQAKN